MHWIQWDRVLSFLNDGGLGVGSLFTYNRALLLRWYWHFFHYPYLLWVRVMKVIYSLEGQIHPLIPMRTWLGPWNGII